MFWGSLRKSWPTNQRGPLLSGVRGFVRWSLALGGRIVSLDEKGSLKLCMCLYSPNHMNYNSFFWSIVPRIIPCGLFRHPYCYFAHPFPSLVFPSLSLPQGASLLPPEHREFLNTDLNCSPMRLMPPCEKGLALGTMVSTFWVWKMRNEMWFLICSLLTVSEVCSPSDTLILEKLQKVFRKAVEVDQSVPTYLSPSFP